MTVPLVRQDQIPATEASTIAAELRNAARIVSEKIGGIALGRVLINVGLSCKTEAPTLGVIGGL